MAFNGTGSNVTSLNAENISSGTLAVGRGGTGATTLNAAAVIIGNGTSAPTFVAPGSNGNILTSNGTAWTSATPAGGGVTSLNGQTGAITNTGFNNIGSYSVAYLKNGQSTQVTAGATASGTNFFQVNADFAATFGPFSNGASNLGSNQGQTGTWRAMALSRNGAQNCCGWYPTGSNIWVRIS
jgi:hypothetical protein